MSSKAQDSSAEKSHASDKDHIGSQQPDRRNLVQELRAMQTKIASLEAALKQNHKAAAAAPAQSTHGRNKGMPMGSMGGKQMGMGMGMMSGMSSAKMPRKGKMGMGMMVHPGMKMMGRMKGMGPMQMSTSLPGFPGASHIYHIGATAFFLDHPLHIALNAEQQKQLNGIKQAALLGQATFDRRIDQAEQEVWVLTSADVPDVASIEAKVREIAKLTGDKRIAYIRAVGNAAGVLTDEQRKSLVEHLPAQHAASGSNAQH